MTDDYRDAYTFEGNSSAGATDAVPLSSEPWNDLAGGEAKIDTELADPNLGRTSERRQHLIYWKMALAWKKQQIRDRLDQFEKAAKDAECCICPEWLIAVWWDERSRMGAGMFTEKAWDNLWDAEGADDVSTGPFQMQGKAAKEAVDAASSPPASVVGKSANELQDIMQDDFGAAAYLAAAYMCLILARYRAAGWDPCTPGKISSIELIGTAYSLGPRPKDSPQTNGRGCQVARWAEDAKRIFELPDCDCDCQVSTDTSVKSTDTSVGKLREWEAELERHRKAEREILGEGSTSMGALRAWEAEVARHQRELRRIFGTG